MGYIIVMDRVVNKDFVIVFDKFCGRCFLVMCKVFIIDGFVDFFSVDLLFGICVCGIELFYKVDLVNDFCFFYFFRNCFWFFKV